MKSRMLGFTLIELMIVVAIVAILAAIAYPSYEESVRRSRRTDAKAVLIEAAQWMERFYTSNLRYDQDINGALVTSAGQFPGSGLTMSPRGGPAFYNIGLQAVTQSSFTLRAVAVGAQSNDPCGNFTLTEAGVRNVTGSRPAAECWR